MDASLAQAIPDGCALHHYAFLLLLHRLGSACTLGIKQCPTGNILTRPSVLVLAHRKRILAAGASIVAAFEAGEGIRICAERVQE